MRSKKFTITDLEAYYEILAAMPEDLRERLKSVMVQKEKPDLPQPAAWALNIADWLHEQVVKLYPRTKAYERIRWGRSLEKFIRALGGEEELDASRKEVCEVLTWLFRSLDRGAEFWRRNVRSPSGLEKHYPVLHRLWATRRGAHNE